MTKKELAGKLARQLSSIYRDKCQGIFDSYLLNPSDHNFAAAVESMRRFQEARDMQHSIANWDEGA
jgi:hypothetical protein